MNILKKNIFTMTTISPSVHSWSSYWENFPYFPVYSANAEYLTEHIAKPSYSSGFTTL